MTTDRKTWWVGAVNVGNHVNVAVRFGVEGQRALLGTLRMTDDEWIAFQELLQHQLSPGRLTIADPVDPPSDRLPG